MLFTGSYFDPSRECPSLVKKNHLEFSKKIHNIHTMYVCMYVCMHACMHTHTHVCTYNTYTYTYTYSYITHTHKLT